MQLAKLSKSGQIYMPKEFRDMYPNVDYFQFEINDGTITYKPLKIEQEPLCCCKLEAKKHKYQDFLKQAKQCQH